MEDANLTNEIQRKVAHTFTQIDQIIAQYGEGSQHETHTESYTRQIREFEAKWKQVQAQFRSVKPGPNFEEDYKNMKREVVGPECK